MKNDKLTKSLISKLIKKIDRADEPNTMLDMEIHMLMYGGLALSLPYTESVDEVLKLVAEKKGNTNVAKYLTDVASSINRQYRGGKLLPDFIARKILVELLWDVLEND